MTQNKPKNLFLYKTDVEDWKEKHAIIWRLKLKLNRDEWALIKQYFKYYKNRNLVGWGTTHPLEVTEILITIRGDDTIKTKLHEINDGLEKIRQSKLNGYGQWHEFDWEQQHMDLYDEKVLKTQKRELLGLA